MRNVINDLKGIVKQQKITAWYFKVLIITTIFIGFLSVNSPDLLGLVVTYSLLTTHFMVFNRYWCLKKYILYGTEGEKK